MSHSHGYDSHQIYLDNIDSIDEGNRLKDIMTFLNESITEENESMSHFLECSHDFEGQSGNFDKITSFDDIHAYSRNDVPKSPNSFYNLIKNLISVVHTQNMEINSLNLQLQHKVLQTQSFMNRDFQLQSENEKLGLSLARKEQDCLLLESKIQDIANFENHGIYGNQLEGLRGQLLSVANNQISELKDDLIACEANLSINNATNENLIHIQMSEINFLKQELQNVCDQLAQRTILYASQERRWLQDYRMNTSESNNLNNELIEKRSKLELFESRYTELDKERISLVLQNKELVLRNEELANENYKLNEKTIELERDISNNLTLTIDLQSTINRLRNSDYDTIERDLTFELENMKSKYNLREEIYKKQIEELNSQIIQFSDKNDFLANQMNDMKKEINHKNQLLVEFDHMLKFNYTQKNTSSLENRSYVEMEEFNDMNIETNNISNQLNATKIITDSNFIEQLNITNNNANFNTTYIISESSTNESNLIEQVDSTDANITVEYLVGESSNSNNIIDSTSSNVLNTSEISYDMKMEINFLQQQVYSLQSELKVACEREQKHKSKLALVLRKASQIYSYTSMSNVDDNQIDFYKSEIANYEQLFVSGQNRDTESLLIEKDIALKKLQVIFNEKIDELKKLKLEKEYTSQQDIVSSGEGINVTLSDDKIKQMLIYPEMLSPDVTLQIVKCIASRSYCYEDFIELYEQAKSSTSY